MDDVSQLSAQNFTESSIKTPRITSEDAENKINDEQISSLIIYFSPAIMKANKLLV